MLRIGKEVNIHPTAEIEVENGYIGDYSTIRAYASIRGRDVRIGRGAMICEYAVIGGGSCYDPTSRLEVGDFFHLGRNAFLNQGYGVRIGHEVGLGIETKIYTHGAYESAWDGFPSQWGPVTIGDRVWIPYAQVNPNVNIGSDVVVLAMSLVNRDLPSGCLAGGIPCKVLKENAYPKKLTAEEKEELFKKIFNSAVEIYKQKHGGSLKESITYVKIEEDMFSTMGATFDIGNRKIEGSANDFTEILKNQLRRNGIRFRFRKEGEAYVPW